LTSVALGPPQPTARRRIDPAHVVQATAEAEPAPRSTQPASNGPSLVNLLKVPLEKFTPENIVQGSKKIGQIALWLQQPKMMLAAVAAVALQLAAVLAMLTGSGDKPADESSGGARQHDHAQHGPHGLPGTGIVDHRRPIQTPINAPSQYSPMPSEFGPRSTGPQRGPASVAQPSPPQPLPGVQPDELPAWPGAEGPSLVGTGATPLGTGAHSGTPAASSGMPTMAPGSGSTRVTPVGTSGKPKLRGTILKVNEDAR
jgi:hypothetical protein